jgi:hypothetical protein
MLSPVTKGNQRSSSACGRDGVESAAALASAAGVLDRAPTRRKGSSDRSAGRIGTRLPSVPWPRSGRWHASAAESSPGPTTPSGSAP